MDKEFDKNSSHSVKGIAILMMVAHHLYTGDISDGLQYGQFDRFFGLIGTSGKLCVTIFMFVSGYGIWVSSYGLSGFSGVLNKVLRTYLEFWKVFVPTTILWLILGKLHFDLAGIIANGAFVSSSYNGTWWFLQIYVILVILFPVIRQLLDLDRKITASVFLLSVFIFPEIAKHIRDIGYFGEKADNLLFYSGAFIFGVIVAKHSLVTRLNSRLGGGFRAAGVHLLIMLIALILRGMYSIHAANLGLAFSICGLSVWIKPQALRFLGKYSMGMWLVHDFMIEKHYFGQSTLSLTKNPVAAYLLITVISLAIAIILQQFWGYVNRTYRAIRFGS